MTWHLYSACAGQWILLVAMLLISFLWSIPPADLLYGGYVWLGIESLRGHLRQGVFEPGRGDCQDVSFPSHKIRYRVLQRDTGWVFSVSLLVNAEAWGRTNVDTSMVTEVTLSFGFCSMVAWYLEFFSLLKPLMEVWCATHI